MESIRQGEFVLMDGALGTELERRGVQIEGGCWGIGPTHIEALSRNRILAGF